MSSVTALAKKNSDITTIAPTPQGADALEIIKHLQQHKTGALFLARDDKRAHLIRQQLSFYAPQLQTIYIPAWDCLPYDRVSPAVHISSLRTEALCRIANLDAIDNIVVITTINSALQKLPPKSSLASRSIHFQVNKNYKRQELLNQLINAGYNRNAAAHEPGEFAVRGAIIDIIPTGSESGYRLDFFDDTLETVRIFDPLTQISKGSIKELTLAPASEIILDEPHIDNFKNNYRELFGTTSQDDMLYHAVLEGRHYPGMEHWMPLFYNEVETLFNYLPEVSTFFDHLCLEAKEERLTLIDDYYTARKESDANAGLYSSGGSYNPIPIEKFYVTDKSWSGIFNNKSNVFSFSPYNTEQAVKTHYQFTPNFLSESKAKTINCFDFFKETLPENKTIIVACYSEGTRSRLERILDEHAIKTLKLDNWQDINKAPKSKTVILSVFPCEKGFYSEHLYIVSEQDLLGEKHNTDYKKKKRSANFLQEAASLCPGELIVHKEHGIGRFVALETLKISEEEHDCLQIEYHGGDKLYVPVEYMDLLTRYGNDNEAAQLDKLGNTSWQARKAKLKKRLKVVAGELIELAAKRSLYKAPVIMKADGLYEEFCGHFPYAETDDQLRCIDDVVDDLASGRPMDRLICGDVGFGKTEIALRASFLAASNETAYQVALIAPTTLLARQHYLTFKQRFEHFPIEIKMLSRLTTTTEAKKIKQGLSEGKIDIVIGTHALLAKNIEFKNLGLVIIDEEQQFGVAQKEKFKQLRTNIHMLTLTATPIPRTLQMSLTGIKDLSIIATPPVDRLTIRSFTMPFDGVVIRNAVLREYYRGGGIFVVVPRISDLDDISEKLKKIIPEVKISIAHGQLPPEQLDKTMTDFCDGKFDILISTNIIGSGLDIPRVNTIIVHKADLFGLAQLYQMRGRVGRGKIRAYAYFTLPPRKKPTPAAVKRLEVMQSLDSLGAGFTLASHDMDMRGFGNLLGDEQSGNIKEVGVELYQDMLKNAIAGIKEEGDLLEEEWSPQINLGLPVLIPENYIQDLEVRMGLYRRISTLKSQEAIEEIRVEMVDRFGAIPEECENLLSIVSIKLLCFAAGVSKIDLGPKGLLVSFHNDSYKDPERLIELVTKRPTKIKLRNDQKIIFFCEGLEKNAKINFTSSTLNELL